MTPIQDHPLWPVLLELSRQVDDHRTPDTSWWPCLRASENPPTFVDLSFPLTRLYKDKFINGRQLRAFGHIRGRPNVPMRVDASNIHKAVLILQKLLATIEANSSSHHLPKGP